MKIITQKKGLKNYKKKTLKKRKTYKKLIKQYGSYGSGEPKVKKNKVIKKLNCSPKPKNELNSFIDTEFKWDQDENKKYYVLCKINSKQSLIKTNADKQYQS